MSESDKKFYPLALANTFIERHGRREGIQHMKLQKLSYFAHGWWLAYNSESFLKEKPQVWKYGPVFKSLYRILAPFGKEYINLPQKDNPFEAPEVIEDKQITDLVDWVWTRYLLMG